MYIFRGNKFDYDKKYCATLKQNFICETPLDHLRLFIPRHSKFGCLMITILNSPIIVIVYITRIIKNGLWWKLVWFLKKYGERWTFFWGKLNNFWTFHNHEFVFSKFFTVHTVSLFLLQINRYFILWKYTLYFQSYSGTCINYVFSLSPFRKLHWYNFGIPWMLYPLSIIKWYFFAL